MQNAGQHYGQGGASSHQTTVAFGHSETTPTSGSITSSLRQFRRKPEEKHQQQETTQTTVAESHVARVAPHNHFPHNRATDCYPRYPIPYQDYSVPSQVKYSEISEPHQSIQDHISPSVIQKAKGKEYMEMCNIQQPHMKQSYTDHLNGQQAYPDPNVLSQNQYIPKESQVQSLYKPESQYYSKEHQYPTQIPHQMQKYNMPNPQVRKFPENDFLSKLQRIHPSMARSIMSDHHLQESQRTYQNMDQSRMYPHHSQRYMNHSTPMQGNMYPHSYMAPQPYSNYPASCSYTRSQQMAPRFPAINPHERSISPRRTYSDGMTMTMGYGGIPPKISPNYQYNAPDYTQHYQQRRSSITQDYYQQHCRPTQYLPHQMPPQEIPESRVTVSDNIKQYIENWADEDTASEMNQMENNRICKENIRLRDEQSTETVYTINASELQYLEPLVSSENGIPLVASENGQYIIKSGVSIDNASGMIRIIDKNNQMDICDPSGERIVNLHIMDPVKPDCMLANKPNELNQRPTNENLYNTNEKSRVVIHQNTVIQSGFQNSNNNNNNNTKESEQETNLDHAKLNSSLPIITDDQVSLEEELNRTIIRECRKETADKNCSPINLEQLEALQESESQQSSVICPIKPNNYESDTKDSDKNNENIGEINIKNMPNLEEITEEIQENCTDVNSEQCQENKLNENNNETIDSDNKAKYEDVACKEVNLIEDQNQSSDDSSQKDALSEKENDEIKYEIPNPNNNLNNEVHMEIDETINIKTENPINEPENISQQEIKITENTKNNNHLETMPMLHEENILMSHENETTTLLHFSEDSKDESEKENINEVCPERKGNKDLEEVSTNKVDIKTESEGLENECGERIQNSEENSEEIKMEISTENFVNAVNPNSSSMNHLIQNSYVSKIEQELIIRSKSKRSKRIFSVDDIINNIGNTSIKPKSKEERRYSLQSTREFLDNEIKKTSLLMQEMLNETCKKGTVTIGSCELTGDAQISDGECNKMSSDNINKLSTENSNMYLNTSKLLLENCKLPSEDSKLPLENNGASPDINNYLKDIKSRFPNIKVSLKDPELLLESTSSQKIIPSTIVKDSLEKPVSSENSFQPDRVNSSQEDKNCEFSSNDTNSLEDAFSNENSFHLDTTNSSQEDKCNFSPTNSENYLKESKSLNETFSRNDIIDPVTFSMDINEHSFENNAMSVKYDETPLEECDTPLVIPKSKEPYETKNEHIVKEHHLEKSESLLETNVSILEPLLESTKSPLEERQPSLESESSLKEDELSLNEQESTKFPLEERQLSLESESSLKEDAFSLKKDELSLNEDELSLNRQEFIKSPLGECQLSLESESSLKKNEFSLNRKENTLPKEDTKSSLAENGQFLGDNETPLNNNKSDSENNEYTLENKLPLNENDVLLETKEFSSEENKTLSEHAKESIKITETLNNLNKLKNTDEKFELQEGHSSLDENMSCEENCQSIVKNDPVVLKTQTTTVDATISKANSPSAPSNIEAEMDKLTIVSEIPIKRDKETNTYYNKKLKRFRKETKNEIQNMTNKETTLTENQSKAAKNFCEEKEIALFENNSPNNQINISESTINNTNDITIQSNKKENENNETIFEECINNENIVDSAKMNSLNKRDVNNTSKTISMENEKNLDSAKMDSLNKGDVNNTSVENNQDKIEDIIDSSSKIDINLSKSDETVNDKNDILEETVELDFQDGELTDISQEIQYRNVIRVEEPSVLLHIAGELVEINVNTVSGKKVITVVPLSSSAVVDLNDNYETIDGNEDTDPLKLDSEENNSEILELDTTIAQSEFVEPTSEIIIGMDLSLEEEIHLDLEQPQRLCTKAAKKAYDSDLQIPSITTSEDVYDQVKTSCYCSNDKVSSSHEQVNIKKRKIENVPSEEPKNILKSNKPKSTRPKKREEKKTEVTQDIEEEVDDEFVPFKELIKARKLKKLKMLEMINCEEMKADSTNKVEELVKEPCKEVSTKQYEKSERKDKVTVEKKKEIKKVKTLSTKNSKTEQKQKEAGKPKDVSAGSSEKNKKVKEILAKNKVIKKVSFDGGTDTVNVVKVITEKLESKEKKNVTEQVNLSGINSKLKHDMDSKKKLSLEEYNKRKRKIIDKSELQRSKRISVSTIKVPEDMITKVRSELANDGKVKFHRLKSMDDVNSKSKGGCSIKRKLSLESSTTKSKSFDWEEKWSPKTNAIDTVFCENNISHETKATNFKLNVDSKNPADEILQNYKEQVESKLSSLNIQIPRIAKPVNQQITTITNSFLKSESKLMERFLKNEHITPEEMQNIRKIISYKRLMQGLKNSVVNPNLSLAYEVKKELGERDMKLHLKKAPVKRRKKRFRNLYSESTSETDTDLSESKASGDYSVIQSNCLAGVVPKLIIKRKPELPLPFVQLERLDMGMLINKKRRGSGQ